LNHRKANPKNPYNHHMIKRFLYTGFICLLFKASFSQTISSQRKEDLNIKKFHTTIVSINSPEEAVSIPIRSISVVDARPDSAAIGFYQVFKQNPRFILTKTGLRTESEQYINKYVHCSKSDSFSVIMVLKKFWISTDVHKFDNRKLQDVEEDTSKQMSLSLFTNIEFYLSKDSGYYALYRFDSVFSVDIKVAMDIAVTVIHDAGNKPKSFAELMIQDALKTSLSKLKTTDWKWNAIVSSKRKFTWHEIEAHEHKVFEIPVLKDDLLVPGVYLTFEEFKFNRPSIKEFEITKDKLNDFIYVKQSDGRQISLVDLWGYCDSSNQIFIRSNHNFFRLQRRQNAFYIYGSNQTVREISNQSGGALPTGNGTSSNAAVGTSSEEYVMVLKPFQLDWDSGKLY
jgi:hypothetical protein